MSEGIRLYGHEPILAALESSHAVAEALRAVGAIYNGFLNAHAQGRAVRMASIVFTVTNLVTNFSLIPAFGAAGAAVASLIAMAASVIAYMRGYRRMRTAPEVSG